MSYLILVLGAMADSLKSVVSKAVGKQSETLSDAFLLTLLRVAFCMGIGLIVCLFTDGGFPQADGKMLLWGAVNGVLTGLFLVCWLLSMRQGAFLLMCVLGTASCSIPLLMSALFYGEQIQPQHIAGFAILLVAVLLLSSYNKGMNGKLTGKGLFITLSVFVLCGVTSFMQKVFVYEKPQGTAAGFQFYTYVFATLCLLILFPVARRMEGYSRPPKELLRVTGLFALIMAAALFACSFCKTIAAQDIPSGILYPMHNALVLLINTVCTALIYHEKLTAKSVVGCLLTVAAVWVMNL